MLKRTGTKQRSDDRTLVSSRRLTVYCVCGGELGVFLFEYSPTRSEKF